MADISAGAICWFQDGLTDSLAAAPSRHRNEGSTPAHESEAIIEHTIGHTERCCD
jgi:hypothetical protein